MTPDMFLVFLLTASALWLVARACETGWNHCRKLARRFFAQPWAERAFALVFFTACCIYGGSKPAVPAGASSGAFSGITGVPAAAALSSSGTLTPDQYAAGLAHVSTSTNTTAWHAAPANAVVHAPWDVYGVAEDTFWLPADGWSFVLGTNGVDGLHVSSSGLVSFGNPLSTPLPSSIPEHISVLAPLHGSFGTVPPLGRFWHAVTPSNSLLCTWQGVCAGRDTNSPVTFQTELFWNGDFTYRYAFTNAPALTNFVVGAQHNGGGETYALNDTDKLADGLELRWRAFGILDPDVVDHDGDGLSTYDEVMLYGTTPSLKDSDGDGLEDAAELAAGTAPLNPDTDGDLAADSIDPAPLTSGDPGEILNCCSNTWLFHVHHALPTNGTCGASGFPHDYNLFAVTVTLNAPVADPGAVLWIGGTPLVMRDPGSWTLWLDKTTNQTVRLCAPRGVGVDYTVSSDVPGFFIQPPPPGPPAPPQSHTETLEGTVAVPFFTVEPASVCFHGEPVTFRAAGCAAGLSGQFVWSYGNTTVVTNAPEFTVGPESGGVPPVVSVTFMPDGLDAAAPARAAAGAGARSAADGWPAGAASACGYCQRHTALTGHTVWWCGLTGKPTNKAGCPAAGRGYIPPVNGTNTFFTLPVPRRPAAWPDGCATLSPWPSGHAGQGTPPNDPDDCGHDPGCSDCKWVVDHWHHVEKTFKWFDHCGCCACPEHNPTAAGEPQSPEPVVYEGAAGLTAVFRPFDGAPFPLAAGPLPGPGVVAVTGLTPSAAPYDRSARFSRHIPSVPTTFYEVDRFTVLSLDLQPDLDLDGSVGSADAAALAADWDRTWLIPAGTNAFPLKVFNDVALPGAYTLALDGPSNIVARYGGVTVRGGGSNAVAIPPGSTAETVLVQADRPCTATLTLSFQGTGAAAGFECETQVEIKAWGVDIVSTGEYPGHAISPLFDGTTGKKWVVATFPEPRQASVAWNVRLVGKRSGTALLKYQRGTEPEEEIQWSGPSAELCFEDGLLSASIRLNDGPGTAPSLALSSGVVTISGVQQGDRIIVEETSGARDEIAVVKNFGWNDLQRLGVGNLRIHTDFDALFPEIKNAIIETVLFCLDVSPLRDQKHQLTNDVFQSTGMYAVSYTNFQSDHPGLLLLDIPSTRSIGIFPLDCDHFHLGLEAADIPPTLAGKKTDLMNAVSSALTGGYPNFRTVTAGLLTDLMNSAHADPLHISFLVFHTYEHNSAFPLAYLSPDATAYLLPGDPIRNVRWSFITNASPLLTYPGQEHDATWTNSNDPPVDLCQIQLFVTRKGEIVLLGGDGYGFVADGQVSDALREE